MARKLWKKGLPTPGTPIKEIEKPGPTAAGSTLLSLVADLHPATGLTAKSATKLAA